MAKVFFSYKFVLELLDLVSIRPDLLKTTTWLFFKFTSNCHFLKYYSNLSRQVFSPSSDVDSRTKSSAYKRCDHGLSNISIGSHASPNIYFMLSICISQNKYGLSTPPCFSPRELDKESRHPPFTFTRYLIDLYRASIFSQNKPFIPLLCNLSNRRYYYMEIVPTCPNCVQKHIHI